MKKIINFTFNFTEPDEKGKPPIVKATLIFTKEVLDVYPIGAEYRPGGNTMRAGVVSLPCIIDEEKNECTMNVTTDFSFSKYSDAEVAWVQEFMKKNGLTFIDDIH